MLKVHGCSFWLKMWLIGKIKSAVILKKKFDSEPVYNNFFLKIMRLSYSNEATDFQDKGIPKAGSGN